MSRLLAKLQSVSDLPQNIAVLVQNEAYPVVGFEISVSSPHGPALMASVMLDGEATKVYLPARYAGMLTPKEIIDYNKQSPQLQITYKGLIGRAHHVEFTEASKQ